MVDAAISNGGSGADVQACSVHFYRSRTRLEVQGEMAIKNIILSADEKLIEAARERAEHTILDEQFRLRPADGVLGSAPRSRGHGRRRSIAKERSG